MPRRLWGHVGGLRFSRAGIFCLWGISKLCLPLSPSLDPVSESKVLVSGWTHNFLRLLYAM